MKLIDVLEAKAPDSVGDKLRKWLKKTIKFGGGRYDTMVPFDRACTIFDDGHITLADDPKYVPTWINVNYGKGLDATGQVAHLNGPIKLKELDRFTQLRSVIYSDLTIDADDIVDTVTVSFIRCVVPSFSKTGGRLSKVTKIEFFDCEFSGVLGLLKLPKLDKVEFHADTSDTKVFEKLFDLGKIMNEHLNGDRKILDCQNELIDAGLEEYANL